MAELPASPQPTVDAIWRAREALARQRKAYEGYGISASALGHECDRKLWLDLRWTAEPEQVDGRRLRIFERGDIEEDRVIADLELAGVEIGRQQERYSLAGGWIRGKVDAVGLGFLEAPKSEHVVEIKSAKAADFRAVVKHGVAAKKPEHWHQVHAGMAALGIARGAYVIVNKDSEEIHIERIRLDVEATARAEARVARIVEADEAPGKVSENAAKPPCLLCRHKGLCHGGEMPSRRHCRTCLHFSLTRAPNGHCARWDEARAPDRQREGCPVHLFLPSLVPGEQVDANATEEWVEYRMADGSIWRDGAEKGE